MQKTIKRAAALSAGAMLVAGIMAPTIVSAWGDNSGNEDGRRSYTISQINAGIIDDKIVFNSISDGVDGDEKNFVDAQASTDNPQGLWQGNNITVENGKEYTIRLYVHNNNRLGREMTAEDVKVFFSIPQTSAKQVQVNGFITSSNATPSKYWDYINFNSDNNAFHLEYVYGSAMLYNNGIGKGGLALNDDVVTKAGGALIGYDALDGRIPGCFDYDSYVTIRVKAVYDTDYTIEKSVRVIGGEKVWSNYVNAKIGDIVEFQVEYNNTSTKNEIQNDVMIKDIMPAGLEYVAGTTKLWNSSYTGAVLTPDGQIFTDAINIGGYKPGSNAYVRFRAKVVEEGLACGDNTLVNWAQGGVGNVTIQDYASVIVNRPCEEPETPNKLPNTGPETVAGGLVAAGSIVTAAGYFVASRRSLR